MIPKRQRHPELWQRNKRKALRYAGEEYATRKGKVVSKKTPDLQYDCKCRMQFSENFSDDERKNSIDSFQQLDWLSQEQLIISSVMEFKLKTRKADSNQFKNCSKVFRIAYERFVKKNVSCDGLNFRSKN